MNFFPLQRCVLTILKIKNVTCPLTILAIHGTGVKITKKQTPLTCFA